MSEEAVRIGLILASVRQGRRGEKFAMWIKSLLEERPGVQVELLDMRDYPIGPYVHEQMPPTIEKTYTDETLRRWSEKIHALDAYVMVTPEYNRGYPGNLKNAIDHVQSGWWYKPVALVSYGGATGGGRAADQLRNVAVEVRMVPVRSEVNVRLVGLEFDDAGRPKDPYYAKTSKAMIDQLLWWTRATKRARAHEAPPTF